MSSTPLGHRDCNITAAWAVDREFFDIYLVPLAALGCLWGVFGSLWDALESLWLSFGAPLAFPWVLWGKFWILSKIGRPIPSKWAVSLQPADKIEPRGTRGTQLHLLRLSTFIYVCYVSDAASAAHSPLSTRAGGMDDGC